MKRKQIRQTVNIFERAYIAKRWRATAVDAEIHAMIGESVEAMVKSAGTVLFVVLGACMAEDVPTDLPEVVDVLDAVEAVHDQVGEDDIPGERRARIVRGLEGARLLIEALPTNALTDAACTLHVKMRQQHIHLSDFHALVGRTAA